MRSTTGSAWSASAYDADQRANEIFDGIQRHLLAPVRSAARRSCLLRDAAGRVPTLFAPASSNA